MPKAVTNSITLRPVFTLPARFPGKLWDRMAYVMIPVVPKKPKSIQRGFIRSVHSRMINDSTTMNRLMPITATWSGFIPNLLRRSATAPIRAKPAIIAAAINSSPLATPVRSRPATSRNQGPAHRVCTARKVDWVMTAQGAIRQNTKLE